MRARTRRALTKAVDIIAGITDDRNLRRAQRGQPSLDQSTAWSVGLDGKLHHKVDSGGNDSDWDSMELMVGGAGGGRGGRGGAWSAGARCAGVAWGLH